MAGASTVSFLALHTEMLGYSYPTIDRHAINAGSSYAAIRAQPPPNHLKPHHTGAAAQEPVTLVDVTEPSSANVRAWAREMGHPVADFGRIPAVVREAYTAAHQEAPHAKLDPAEGPAPTQSASFEEPERAPSWDADPPPVWGSDRRPPAWGGTPPAAPTHNDRSTSGFEWDPAPVPAGDATKRPDGYAVASLVLGLFPIMCGLFAIVFGIVALGRIRLSQRPGRGMAIAGIVGGGCWMVVFAAGVALQVATQR